VRTRSNFVGLGRLYIFSVYSRVSCSAGISGGNPDECACLLGCTVYSALAAILTQFISWLLVQELAGGTPQPYRMREMAAQLQKSIRFDTDPRRAVKEPPGNREMTFEEKRKLSIAIGRLPGDRLAQVMDIIAEDPFAANVRSLSCGIAHFTRNGISVWSQVGTITRSSTGWNIQRCHIKGCEG
jgi:hypothetical protein